MHGAMMHSMSLIPSPFAAAKPTHTRARRLRLRARWSGVYPLKKTRPTLQSSVDVADFVIPSGFVEVLRRPCRALAVRPLFFPLTMLLALLMLADATALNLNHLPAALTATDPFQFSSPSFGRLADVAGEPAVHQLLPEGSVGLMVSGVALYASAMFMLTSWQKHMLPKYMSPEHYEKMTGWTHPANMRPATVTLLTADLPFGLPKLEDLHTACALVGASTDWNQYLCAVDPSVRASDDYDACERSDEWSDLYGAEIAVCHRRRVR